MNLAEKLDSIEQNFLRRSPHSTTLSTLDDLGSRDPNNAIGEEQPKKIYTWRSFKKYRAIISAILTVASTATALCTMLSIVWYLLGIWGSLYLWLFAELLFMAIQWGIYRRLNALHVQIPDDYDGLVSFRRFAEMAKAKYVDGSRIFNLEAYISEWAMPFMGAKLKDIKRENLMEILTYGFCYRTPKEMVEAGYHGVPESILNEFEELMGRKFVDGYDPRLRYMAHMRENLHIRFQPIGFYVFTEFAGVLSSTVLVALGFRKIRRGWTFATYTFGCLDRSGPKPIVFLHGVGLGVLPYIDFISSLVCTGHPIVIIEYRHISMRLTIEIPSCTEVAAVVIAEMDRLSIPKACFVAHSYGTLVLTRIVKICPQRIHACCFIDPVCLGMFLPQLLSQFVYLPESSGGISDRIRECLRMAVSREMGVAATIARRLTWSDVNLWPEELIPHRSLIVFSGKDVLVPSKEMMPIFKASASKTRGLKMMIHDHLAHGEFLIAPKWKLEIVNEIAALAAEVKEGDSRREKVARKQSLLLSLDAMDDVRSTVLRSVDDRLWDGVRRTLSFPWICERRSFASLSRLSSAQ